MREFKDKFGNVLQVGDFVYRASVSGRSARLELRQVERIENDSLYLNGSKGSEVQRLDTLAKVGGKCSL